MPTAQERREELTRVFHEARECPRCPELVATRTQVVFGAGNADADLMFVGEAPGKNEDEGGRPFIGQAGKFLDKLLGEVGIARDDVFIANVLKCRPPGNRDPAPVEIERCQEWLWRQLELIEPRVVCTLGNFATKLLRGDPTGITRVHGQAEVRVLGRRAVRLMPLFHPAAALYNGSMQEVLRADFALLAPLLDLEPPAQPEVVEAPQEGAPEEEVRPDAQGGDAPGAVGDAPVEPPRAADEQAAATEPTRDEDPPATLF